MKRLLILSLVALASCESEYARRCRDNGGVIHQVNCTLVPIPQYDADGHFTHFLYVRSCDEKCVGAGLEKKDQ